VKLEQEILLQNWLFDPQEERQMHLQALTLLIEAGKGPNPLSRTQHPALTACQAISPLETLNFRSGKAD